MDDKKPSGQTVAVMVASIIKKKLKIDSSLNYLLLLLSESEALIVIKINCLETFLTSVKWHDERIAWRDIQMNTAWSLDYANCKP